MNKTHTMRFMTPFKVLTPYTFKNGAQSRNRVWLAPLTNLQSHPDGTLSNDEHNWLLHRALGGFGVVETCAAYVSQDGKAWDGELGVTSDSHLEGLTRLSHALKTAGSLSIAQLFHGGTRASSKISGVRTWSASEWREDRADFEVPRAATPEDIERVITQFCDAAHLLVRAGFSGTELHGAHGYLLGQFLSQTMNTREDEWGGSLENRARLMRQITRTIRAAVPTSFILGMRISPEDFGQAKGLDLDENLQLSEWLAEDGIDFLHLSLWDSDQNTKKRPSEHPVPLFRRALPKEIALVSSGAIWTREQAEKQLSLGADFVALGRSAIGIPDWPLKAAAPEFAPQMPPYSPQELRDRMLSERFIEYMRRWKGFVKT